MTADANPIATLDPQDCWDLLAQQSLGRIVTRVGDHLDVFPVNYAVDDGAIVFRTAEGSKLLELTVNAEVLFEVDDFTETEAWSVIIRGRADHEDGSAAIARAEALGLRPWIPTLKYNVVRVVAHDVSGRAFRRGHEPEHFGVADY